MMVVALVSSVAVLMGGVGGASATSLARIGTTTAITVSPAAATTSQTVSFGATITAASGAAPTGSVEFDAHFTATGGTTGTDIVLGTQTLTPGTGSASTATLSLTGMQAGTYQVTGSYSTDGSINWGTSTSAVSPLSVGSALLNTVTMSFSLSSQTITAGQSVTFTTTVTGQPGQPAPTGSVVFSSGANVTSQNTIATIPLTGGTATTAPIGGWSGGTYIVAASYQGDAIYQASSMNLILTVNPAVNPAVTTTTTVTLTPSTIAAGGSVNIKAHVAQVGNPTPPAAGALVDLSVGPAGGDPSQAIPLAGFQAVPLDANGNISVTTGGWTVGNWVVYAGYEGDIFDQASNGSAALTVVQPSNGATVTYTGATQAAWGDTATLSGNLVSGSSALAGKTLTFTMGGATCSGTTNASGDASCQMAVTALPGPHALTVAFAGDATYQSASDDATLTVATVPTSTSYTGATTGGTSQSVTLSAHLQRVLGSTPIASEPVTLTMGAESCTAPTNASGDASCPVTVSEGPGSYPISATFLGDGGYVTSSATGTFTVAAQPTATATSNVAASPGAAATFSATLTSNGSPVAGKSISIVAGSQSCTAGPTDASGKASCTVTVSQASGTYTLTATFAGDATYTTSTGTATFTVQNGATTTTYTGAASGQKGSAATLSAHLVDGAGHPISGKTITITVGTQSCTTGATNATGDASCTITLTQTGGSYPLTATFAGDTTYSASTGTATFTIIGTTKPTIVKILPVAPVLKGDAVPLIGVLFSGILPVGGRTLTLSLGTKSCTAVTNIIGIASCSVTASDPSGQVQAKAAFAGDSTYQASFDTTTVVIYTFAPGGGAFVVGDRSDTGSVTFWGAQWSKSNSISGGSASSSFKGFAVSPTTPQCGGTWSTDPGNSAPPPAGPLPAYMAVVVTSSTSKSGSKISGTIVAIILVKTDSGYQSNPGHAGTGTVVATLCENTTHGGNGGGGNGGCPNFGF